MRMPCEHGEPYVCSKGGYWQCDHDHPEGHHRLAHGCRTIDCPGGREATAADLVAELRRLDAIDYEAATMRYLDHFNYGLDKDDFSRLEWNALRRQVKHIVDAALPEGGTK